ncbi:hypothetical protein SO802_007566, partial [Lithocarpus litseifolius]
ASEISTDLAVESLQFDFVTIEAATNKFSDDNKIGEGGFGKVYKGVLLDGKEVAVKRFSSKSLQGLEEFKNEIILIAKLQHRNLVSGYMAPEYAMEGVSSVKSDVFSFSVILLEIISGKKNSGFYLTEHAQTLLAYEDPQDRPTMSTVVALLGNDSIALPKPKHPAFSMAKFIQMDEFSVNDLSFSSIVPQ